MYDKREKLHIVAVTALVRNDAGEYLLLKRSDNETAFPGHFTFPGGKVEENQTIDEALVEEIKEETGLDKQPGKMFVGDASFVRPDDQTVKVLSFLCEVDLTDEVVVEEESFDEYQWVKPVDLGDLKHVGIEAEIKKAEELIGSTEFSKVSIDSKSS